MFSDRDLWQAFNAEMTRSTDLLYGEVIRY